MTPSNESHLRGMVTQELPIKLRCTRCKQEKDSSEFHRNKFHRTGFNNECKLCRINTSSKSELRKLGIGYYESRKEEYADKIIEYPEAPNGKAYIGFNKEPLMKNENGYGFLGVLIQDDTRKLVQCHSCGVWLQRLTEKHLRICCNLDTREYKKKYGLFLGPGLVSDEWSYRATRWVLDGSLRGEEMREARRKRGIENAEKYFGKRKRHGKIPVKDYLQFQNERGTCPEQIKFRLKQFVKENKELPTMLNRGRPLAVILTSRFGTLSNGLKNYGLPYRNRQGGRARTINFPDGSKIKFDLQDLEQRELFYQAMIQKCPILNESI